MMNPRIAADASVLLWTASRLGQRHVSDMGMRAHLSINCTEPRRQNSLCATETTALTHIDVAEQREEMPVELVAELAVLLGGVLAVLGMLLRECEGDVELLDPDPCARAMWNEGTVSQQARLATGEVQRRITCLFRAGML